MYHIQLTHFTHILLFYLSHKNKIFEDNIDFSAKFIKYV